MDTDVPSKSVDSVLDFYNHFLQEAESCESADYDSRFRIIKETLFALNPFPKCSTHGCACFGRSLQHEYQEVSLYFPERKS